MIWVGLTGGIASGKSTVAQILVQLGESVIDADRIAHQVVAAGTEGLKMIEKKFGADSILPTGELNRSKMGQLVFSDLKSKEALEQIVHPLVQEEVRRQRQWLQDQGLQRAFYDVPLLFEKNLQKQFDKIVVVTTSLALQKQRMQERNQWSQPEIERRLRAQMPLAEKEKQADFVLVNDGDLKKLQKQIEKMLASL